MTQRSPLDPAILHFRNPAYAGYFADPFVFRHGDLYYAVGTGPSEREDRMFPMLRSADFVTWHPIEPALDLTGVPFGTAYWAPEIAYADGRFYLYYSVGQGDKGHQLRVAVADQPDGPYRDTGTPVLDPATCGFAIDANPFQDDDGAWYLLYARDFLDDEDGNRPGTALVIAPLIDMVRVGPEYTVVLRARHDWQRYQAARPMYGATYDWHTLEGPCMVKHDGRYYCLYSGGNWQGSTYGLDYCVSDHILGPYEDTSVDHARVLRTVPKKVIGPGHNSVVLGPDGETLYVAYHAWDVAMTARRLCFDRLIWTPQGPLCLGPSWEPQEVRA